MDKPRTGDAPRSACREELVEVIALVEQVFRLDVGQPPTMGQEFPTLLSADNIDNLFVLRADGRIVSLVGCYGQTLISGDQAMPVACIGAVCTHREYRRRGYAGLLMDLAIARARAAGHVVMLISGRANLYLSRGASRITPVYHATVPGAAVRVTTRDGARAYTDDDFDAVVSLHDKQPLRYRWDPAPTRAMLGAHLDLGCRAWVHEAAGGVDGFLLVQTGPPRWGGTPGHGRAVDWFGAVPAIAPLCAAVVHELGVDALDFAVLHAQTERLRALEQLGISLTRAPWPWTVKVLDLAAVLDGWVGHGNGSARIAADGDTLIVATDETEVALEEAHAVNALLFNDAEHWPAAVRRLPPEARAALAERLPVPVCSYGVNYI